MDRIEILLRSVSRSSKIIEIGPCHSPIAPKRGGWNTFSIDHTDRGGLLAKYGHDPSVNTDVIEEVDFVWKGGELSDAVPDEHRGTFDVFIASHVIEHTPDLVAFLRSAEVLLKPNGHVILAVPDKRVCFDYYRPVSTIGDVVEAHRQRRTRHSEQTLWDNFTYQATRNGQPGWLHGDRTEMRNSYTFSDASALCNGLSVSTDYVDAHSWVFVPSSFSLILLMLARLELSDWAVRDLEVAPATEFYVRLARGGQAAANAMSEQEFSAERQRLLTAMMAEMAEEDSPIDDRAENERLKGALADAQSQADGLRTELQETKQLVVTLRASRAWRIRTRLRGLLGYGATIADRKI